MTDISIKSWSSAPTPAHLSPARINDGNTVFDFQADSIRSVSSAAKGISFAREENTTLRNLQERLPPAGRITTPYRHHYDIHRFVRKTGDINAVIIKSTASLNSQQKFTQRPWKRHVDAQRESGNLRTIRRVFMSFGYVIRISSVNALLNPDLNSFTSSFVSHDSKLLNRTAAQWSTAVYHCGWLMFCSSQQHDRMLLALFWLTSLATRYNYRRNCCLIQDHSQCTGVCE